MGPRNNAPQKCEIQGTSQESIEICARKETREAVVRRDNRGHCLPTESMSNRKAKWASIETTRYLPTCLPCAKN